MQGGELIEANMMAMIDAEFEELEVQIVAREIMHECMKEGKLLFVKVIKMHYDC